MMRTLKKHFSLLLALIIILGSGVGWSKTNACAEELVEDDDLSESIVTQLDVIHSHLSEMLQTNDSQKTWFYSVMDFDHNGKLEFFAATQHPADRSTNLMVWEMNANDTGLTECVIEKQPDESFPDILSNAADSYYDGWKDRWSYVFYDNIIVSPAEMYTISCSVSLRSGIISYQAYAVEHSELVEGYRYVSHTDTDGNEITSGRFSAMATNAFADAERSSTSFDWFRAENATLERLTDSYKVFAGLKDPTGESPADEPAIMQHEVLLPVQGTAGETDAVYMFITKNPVSEKRYSGEGLKFTANANVYDSAYWTFISPDGGEYDLSYFSAHFVYSFIDGAYSSTLVINNLDVYMDGWGAYCTFDFKGQTARTGTAWITIRDAEE